MSAKPEGPAHGGPVGEVYLIHFSKAYKHARHYTGFTTDLPDRLKDHEKGRGARLMEVIKEAGITWRVVRTWTGTRALERAIKDMRAAPQLCPECSPHPLPLTKGRAARFVKERAGPAAQPPARQALPGPPAALTGRQASPAPELVNVPDPGALVPSVFPGRPAGRQAYRDLAELTDRLIDGWRAELDAGTGPPAAGPGRPSPGAAAARADWLRPEPAVEATPVTTPYAEPDYTSLPVIFQPSPYDAGITDDPELTWDQARALPEAEAEAEATP
jgi:predicted GIY-YIG superfamily endonuclease